MANTKRANTSGITKTGTAISDVPDVPTIGTATAGDTTASVTFTAAVTGGTPTLYRAISTPDSIQGTNTASPISITGLTNGTAYTFTVRGENSTANGPYSSATTAVTPISPSFYSISTVSVGSGGQTTISFTSIPQTYKTLQIRGSIRSTASGGVNNVGTYMRFNGDTGSNYIWHEIYANSSSVGGYSQNDSSIYVEPFTVDNGSTSGIFANFICDIINYSDASVYTASKTLAGDDLNGAGSGSQGGWLASLAGLWMNNSAVSQIDLNLESGNFAQYSHVALYGIKG